ncbi:MAG: hypothetical protein WCE21_02010 [Candidatus Babeliales bacterium]
MYFKVIIVLLCCIAFIPIMHGMCSENTKLMPPTLNWLPSECENYMPSRNSVMDKAILSGDLDKVRSQATWRQDHRTQAVVGFNNPDYHELWLAHSKAVESDYAYQNVLDKKKPSYRTLATVGLISFSMIKIMLDARWYMTHPPVTIEDSIKQYADIVATLGIGFSAIRVAGKAVGDIKKEFENAKEIFTILKRYHEKQS